VGAPAVGQQRPARTLGDQDEPGPLPVRPAHQVVHLVVGKVAGGELGDQQVGQERFEVGRLAVDAEVERHPAVGGERGDVLLEEAAVAGVDQVEFGHVAEVVVGRGEDRHAHVVGAEDPLAVDHLDGGVRGRSGHHAQALGVDPLGPQRLADAPARRVVPDHPDVAGIGAGPPCVDGHVQGVAARIHHPGVDVAVDAVVADADQLHQ